MRIDVTREDIDAGQCECARCPVALAVRRSTGRGDVFVFPGGLIRVGDKDIAGPPAVAAFIRRFDEAQTRSPQPARRPQPFSFELDA